MAWYDDLLQPVGSLTAQGRANHDKAQALAAMQASPVANKYAGLGVGQTPDNLMSSIAAGVVGHGAAREALGEGPPVPQPTSMDPTWDAFTGFLGRNFTRKGQFQSAADAANAAAPQQPQFPARPAIIGPNDAPAPAAPSAGVPGDGSDGWTLGDLTSLIGGGGGGGQAAAAPTAPVPQQGGNYDPRGTPSPIAPVAATPPAQPETLTEQLQKYKDMISAIYPKQDTSATPDQVRADKFAAGELQRSQLMAQLALASGITAQAGYGEIAKGFGAAASVENQGFQRYQNALQDGADRELKKRGTGYADDLTRSQAAYKLYSDQQTLGRDAIEKRRQENINFLQSGKPPGEMATNDPDAYNAAMDKYRRSYGEYLNDGQLPPFDGDVRDSKQ